MAKLPHKNVDRQTLADMSVGDIRFTVPWAMWVDADMDCWLRPDFPAAHEPGGTVQMRVERHTYGYTVDIPPGAKYQPSDSTVLADRDPADRIPVAEIH